MIPSGKMKTRGQKRAGWAEDLTTKQHRGISRERNSLHLDCGGEYMTTRVDVNSKSHTPKKGKIGFGI